MSKWLPVDSYYCAMLCSRGKGSRLESIFAGIEPLTMIIGIHWFLYSKWQWMCHSSSLRRCMKGPDTRILLIWPGPKCSILGIVYWSQISPLCVKSPKHGFLAMDHCQYVKCLEAWKGPIALRGLAKDKLFI